MAYTGKSLVLSNIPFGQGVYNQNTDQYGDPPPEPPIKYLAQENNFLILQENGYKILV